MFFTLDTLVSKTPTNGPVCSECRLFQKHKRDLTHPVIPPDATVVIHSSRCGGDDLDGAVASVLGGLDIPNMVTIGHAACGPLWVGEDSKTAAQHCQGWLASVLKAAKPRCVIPIGQEAISATISPLWGKPAGVGSIWAGRVIPDQTLNAWICPIATEGMVPDLRKLYTYSHLNQAARVASRPRPWAPVPGWSDMVERIFNPREAVAALHQAATLPAGYVVAYDYEATGLKPEHKNHRIHSIGLAWGTGFSPERAVAMPWDLPGVPEAATAFLTSPVAKVAANMKFEQRWTQQKLGVEPVNVVWDTQLAGHWVDPQEEGVTGLKYQAYAELGFPLYNQEIESYLHSTGDGAMALNRIFEAPVDSILKYCGLDGLLEYVLARKQMKFANMPEGVTW